MGSLAEGKGSSPFVKDVGGKICYSLTVPEETYQFVRSCRPESAWIFVLDVPTHFALEANPGVAVASITDPVRRVFDVAAHWVLETPIDPDWITRVDHVSQLECARCGGRSSVQPRINNDDGSRASCRLNDAE